MECSICFEKFFIPNTKEELEQLYKENVKDLNEKMKNLLITKNHNNSHSCSTPNCKSLICSECWFKIMCKGKDLNELEIDDLPNKYEYFNCPLCRQIDWKYYMNNVFNELQEKVLGQEHFFEFYIEKLKENGFKF